MDGFDRVVLVTMSLVLLILGAVNLLQSAKMERSVQRMQDACHCLEWDRTVYCRQELIECRLELLDVSEQDGQI